MTDAVLVKEVPIEEAVKVNATIVEFGEAYSKEYFENRYKGKEPLILGAYLEEKPAGYIVGYDKYEDGSFYCWMAGVNPQFRRKGVLKSLMNYQEQWARNHGYISLKIKTRNNKREMLSYLVKYGFLFRQVIERNDRYENRILLENIF